MLIADRNGFATRRRWKNPYVTDGLIAMWDGEWNAGVGKHDPNATVWRDLVGGNDVGSFVSGVSFGDNYLRLPATRYPASFAPYAAGYIKTVEVVIKPDGYNAQVFINFSWDGVSLTNRWFGIRANSTFNFAQRGDAAMVATPTAIHYYAGTSSSDLFDYVPFSALYLDGIQQAKGSEGMSWVGADNKSGFLNTIATTMSSSNIYAIRLHSRELTASEIAANYAVDKARFNLP